MSSEASSRICMTSSMSCISSRSTEATMMRAEDAVALACETMERGFGQRLADEAGEQEPQVSDRGSTAPNPFSRRASAEDVHELVGLAALDDGLRGHQRDGHVEPDVGDHRPEQGMRDRIETGKSEQLVGAQ